MLISIVIPTRERAEVLRHSLASCTRIVGSEVEIIVSDNASLDGTAAVVAANGDGRIRYLRTQRRCSMRENFEFAVSNARGEYVIVIGDDDGLIPNQFPYLRAVLEERRPDSLIGSVVTYAWPGDSAPATSGRLKLLYKSTYGGLEEVSGSQLRERLQRHGATIVPGAPRIYGGVVSRDIVEKMRVKSRDLFMTSWPDIYFMFASPAVIERHLVMRHPFFLGGTSPKSNGASFHRWLRADGPAEEFRKFVADAKSDPLPDPLPMTLSLQIGMLSNLEAAKLNAYGGKLDIDYEREFERAIESLREADETRRAEAFAALARFAAELGLPEPLRDEHRLSARCAPQRSKRQSGRRARVRGYVAIDRVVVDLVGRGSTDIDAAASRCERLLGASHPKTRLGRLAAWTGLVRRAIA